jgi:hypothetical protein
MPPNGDSQVVYMSRWLEWARRTDGPDREMCLRLARLSEQGAVQIDKSRKALEVSRELLVAVDALLQLEKALP